jgi:hypothetical protein
MAWHGWSLAHSSQASVSEDVQKSQWMRCQGKNEDSSRFPQAQLADRGVAAVDLLPEDAFDPTVLH